MHPSRNTTSLERCRCNHRLSATPLRVLFPAYFHRAREKEDGGKLSGLAGTAWRVSTSRESAQSCLTRFARVADSSQLPMLFELRIRPGWENTDLFQTIDGVEWRQNGEQVPPVFTFPADLEVGRHLLMAPLDPLNAAAIAKRSPTLDTTQPAVDEPRSGRRRRKGSVSVSV